MGTTRTTTVAANTMEATAAVPLSKKLTARSANARIRITSRIPTVKENAISPSTRATATATTPTTTVAANTMEATAVRVLSRAELSKQLTANSSSASIPSTKAKAVNPNARSHSSSAMATATTRTTTVAANTMEATAAATLSKKAYCKECKCKDPNYKPNTNCKGKCGLAQFKGDGNCDDENNNCGCAFDGGDCCAKSVKGKVVKTTYCKKCECKGRCQRLHSQMHGSTVHRRWQLRRREQQL